MTENGADYWSLDIPGLTEEDARRLQAAHLDEFPFGVLLLDPSVVMVRGYDRATVTLLAKCVEAGLEAGLDHADEAGAMSMLEDYRDWLSQPVPGHE